MIEALKAAQAELENAYRAAAMPLNAFPKLANGLTADAAKASPEWKIARKNADIAFQALRAFNKKYAKQIAKAEGR